MWQKIKEIYTVVMGALWLCIVIGMLTSILSTAHCSHSGGTIDPEDCPQIEYDRSGPYCP